MIRKLGTAIQYIKYINALRKLPISQRKTLFKLMKIYGQLDKEIGHFKNRIGLNCLPGCGHCCESSKTESTILEAMPLAVELYRLKQMGQWDSNFLLSVPERKCIFYNSRNNISSNGRCTVYYFRPLVCRLFGFSAMQDKNGHSLLYTCSDIKKANPGFFERIQSLINQGLTIPKMRDFSMRVFNLDPYIGRERFPIMEAISKAFDRIEFLYEYKKRNKKHSFSLGKPFKFTNLSLKIP